MMCFDVPLMIWQFQFVRSLLAAVVQTLSPKNYVILLRMTTIIETMLGCFVQINLLYQLAALNNYCCDYQAALILRELYNYHLLNNTIDNNAI